jgi:hypothetical protein
MIYSVLRLEYNQKYKKSGKSKLFLDIIYKTWQGHLGIW